MGRRVTWGSLAQGCDADLVCGDADLVQDGPDLDYGGVVAGWRSTGGCGCRAAAAPPDLWRMALDPGWRPQGWPPCPVARRGGRAAGDRVGWPAIHRRVGGLLPRRPTTSSCFFLQYLHRALRHNGHGCVACRSPDGAEREVGIQIGIIPWSAPAVRDNDDARGCCFSS